MNKEGKKCVIYVRVSTEMQVDGFSLDAQRNVVKRYAEREGMIIKNIYEDAGKSGKSIEGRPSFTKMLNDIKNGLEIDYILVYKLSRFGRNAADILNSIELIQSYDINLIATEEGIDSSQTSGKLLISVLSAVSEIERENILEQTMNGRKEKARQGGWNGGFAPYGYRLENGNIIVNEDEAEVVRSIFNMYAYEEYGCSAIASKLNMEGIKKNTNQTGLSERWSKSMIENVLDNPIYIGKIAFGRRVRKKVKGTKDQFQRVANNDFIISDGKHKAIIDENTWNNVFEKRKKSKKVQPHNSFEKTHMLTSIIKCPICGSGMIIKRHRHITLDGEQRYIKDYMCKYYNVNDSNHEPCNYEGRISNYIIEPFIISIIKNLVATNEVADALKQRIGSQIDTTKFEKQLGNYKENLKQLNATKENLEHKIDYLPIDDKFRDKKLKDYEARLDDMYALIDDVEVQIEELEIKIEGLKNRDITVEKILESLSKISELFDDMNDEERRILVSKLIKSINFDADGMIKNIVFNFTIPGKETKIKEMYDSNQSIEYVYEVTDAKIQMINNLKNQKLPKLTTERIVGGKKKRNFLNEYINDKGQTIVEFEENGEIVSAIKYERSYYVINNNKEKYKRSYITNKDIVDYVKDKYNITIYNQYVCAVKRMHGIEENIDNVKSCCPKNKVSIIEEALKHFNIISQI